VAQAKAHTNKLSATVVSVALDQLGEVVGSLAQKGAKHCRCTGRTVVQVMGLME
jgi:hypothetical protein